MRGCRGDAQRTRLDAAAVAGLPLIIAAVRATEREVEDLDGADAFRRPVGETAGLLAWPPGSWNRPELIP